MDGKWNNAKEKGSQEVSISCEPFKIKKYLKTGFFLEIIADRCVFVPSDNRGYV